MKKTRAIIYKIIFGCFALLVFSSVVSAATARRQTIEPKRMIVLSRYSEALTAAKKQFEAKYGAGLIELETGENDVAPDRFKRADVVVFHYLGGAVFQKYEREAKAAARRGAIVLSLPGDNMERFWGLKPNARLLTRAEKYWDSGGADNLAEFLAMMYQAAGGKLKTEVAEAQTQVVTGIYHPRAKEAFANLNDYLAWYRAQKTVAPDAPLAAILFYSNSYKFKDTAPIDRLINRLEKENIGAVPVFGYPTKTLRAQLTTDGKTSPIRVMLALNLGFSKQDDAAELERYGVPVINLMTTRMSQAEWIASIKGIEPSRLPNQLNAPERAGANEPTIIATTEKIADSDATRSQAIEERVDAAVKRSRRWLTLQDKPNKDKRVGFIYYSNPPGKGYLGASYLNLMPSLVALMNRLKAEGYDTGLNPENEKQLIEMLHRSGRNIEQWAPGELEEMANTGGVTLMPVSRYRELYKDLPAEFRREVERVWGAPEKSDLMTVARGGEAHFVLPGVRLGNLFLGPQPLRSTFARATQVQHDVLTPPPHSYVAAYLWYRYEFEADAVVHMGRHGTLEWLPGKQVGQAGADSSEAVLGDLPNPYYFIIDGGGEAIQARRRAAGVMIGHLTPLIVPGGAQNEYAALHSAIEQYEKVAETAAPLAEEYKKQIYEQIAALKLDKQLAINLKTDSWEAILEKSHDLVHSIKSDPTPMGQATVGGLPSETIQREALENFLNAAFTEEELKSVRPVLKDLANSLFDNQTFSADTERLAPKLQSKLQTAAEDGKKWIENLRRSPGMELDALVKVLSGRYLTSGLLGDPLRNQDSIPSGRNLHDFDTALIPTKAAWELGKKMANATIERFKARAGKFPEKVSMVLWYGETGRNHGAMESEAMYLMGVEPIWNARGTVDNLRLIPDAELGRPRVDVLLTISGIYRDGFADKIVWLDRAARLAAAAGDNALSRNDRRIEAALIKNGVAADKAKAIARARVFGSAPGMYGVGGVGNIVEQSLDEGKGKGLAEMYLHHMNNAYGEQVWGETAAGGINEQLRGNQVVIHPRTTNVYGLLDNDDSYQFAGGLNIASKSVNGGAIPEFYINNMRLQGRERVEEFRTFLVKELSARYWNPKWIKEQQNSGYAGARHFVKEIEHLYGWQATSKEQVDGELWQKSFDVYVADKHGLNMDEFFERENPHARQWQLARMLEVDKQGTYKYSDADRAQLVSKYVASVVKHGAACSANTCGNAKLHQFIAENAAAAGISDQNLTAFAAQMAKATNWNAQSFAGAPAAFQAGLVQGLGQTEMANSQTAASQPPSAAAPLNNQRSAPATPTGEIVPGAGNGDQIARRTDADAAKPIEPPPAENKPAETAPPIVSGYTIEEKIIAKTDAALQTLSTNPLVYLFILMFVSAGLLWEWRRRSI